MRHAGWRGGRRTAVLLRQWYSVHLSSGAVRSKASVARFGPQARNQSHRLEGHLHLLLPSELRPRHPHRDCSHHPRPALACAIGAESNLRKGSCSYVSMPCLSPKCSPHKRGSAEGSILNAEKRIDGGRMSGTRVRLCSDGVGHWPGPPRTVSGWKASPGRNQAASASHHPANRPCLVGKTGAHRCTCACSGVLTPSPFSHIPTCLAFQPAPWVAK